MPQVAGADHQGFSKTTQHAANTHVLQVVNTVDVKTLNIIKKTMQELKVDPDDDQSSKQLIEQVEILQIQHSAEADHQGFENHAASLEHARTSRRL